jgi:hypothetical protein
MGRTRLVMLTAVVGFVAAALLTSLLAVPAQAAQNRGRGAREEGPAPGPQAAPQRHALPPEWERWSAQQRRDWQQRIEKEAPPDFFPARWKDWNAERRARWWHSWEQGNDEEGIFAVAVPSAWKGWSDNHRENWWLEQVWRERLRMLLRQEMDGLLPWAFPSPLPSDWRRWNSAEKDAWLHSESPGHWDDGVLIPKNWNDWKQDRKEDWWDDMADRCGFEPGDIFPRGWDAMKKDQHEEWWGPMLRTGVGYLDSALPDDWRRWSDGEREAWLRGVLGAKESVALGAHARLSAALGSIERAARRGVPPPDAEEMAHQGLLHGLAPDRFPALRIFVVGRFGQGIRGDELRRDILSEIEHGGGEGPRPRGMTDRGEPARGGGDRGRGNDRGGRD